MILITIGKLIITTATTVGVATLVDELTKWGDE